MKVQVRYFASIRERLGAGESVELPSGAAATVAALRELLIARSPAHAEALAQGRAVRSALNQTLCDDSAVIGEDGAEVAFFPPVTGG